MKIFNRDKRIFCAILSSHSRSTGVNLVEADTVVFYDNDLNPVMDAKAQEWCDRIGRCKDIHIYRWWLLINNCFLTCFNVRLIQIVLLCMIQNKGETVPKTSSHFNEKDTRLSYENTVAAPALRNESYLPGFCLLVYMELILRELWCCFVSVFNDYTTC